MAVAAVYDRRQSGKNLLGIRLEVGLAPAWLCSRASDLMVGVGVVLAGGGLSMVGCLASVAHD